MLSASHLKIRQPRIIGVSPRDPHTGDRRPETAKHEGSSWRRSTVTSCRSVSVSAIGVLLRRQSSASHESIRVKVK